MNFLNYNTKILLFFDKNKRLYNFFGICKNCKLLIINVLNVYKR